MSSSARELLAAAGSAEARPRLPTPTTLLMDAGRAARSRRAPTLNVDAIVVLLPVWG